MRLRAVLTTACAAAAVMFAPRAMAQETPAFDLEPIADSELGDLRGGLFVIEGITFDFGAVVRTTIDGKPALETRLTWTPDGMVIEDLSTLTAGALPGLNGWGLDLSDASGMTLVGHRLMGGELQGFILNAGDNRNISQDMEITLTLPGFDAIQRDILTDRLGMRIDMDMAQGLISSSGR